MIPEKAPPNTKHALETLTIFGVQGSEQPSTALSFRVLDLPKTKGKDKINHIS